MTNEQIQVALVQLQEQQVRAAWISAGAAVAQAIGAVVAIVATVILARQSAQRERAADGRAEERAIRADQAAESRAIAADRAARDREVQADRLAEARARTELARQQNAPLDVVVTLADVAILDLLRQEEWFKSKGAEDRTTYGYVLLMSSGRDVQTAIEQARTRVTDAHAIMAMNELRDSFGLAGSFYETADKVALAFGAQAERVKAARDGVEEARVTETA